jgi:hypothetical protein
MGLSFVLHISNLMALILARSFQIQELPSWFENRVHFHEKNTQSS